jgi:hypothetical protein
MNKTPVGKAHVDELSSARIWQIERWNSQPAPHKLCDLDSKCKY